jgi:hypothetical protein
MKRTLTIAVLALAMPALSHATTVIGAGVGELSRDARAIVVGQVVALDARWAADRGRIETVVTLDAQSYLKGALGEEIHFIIPGGQIGRFRNIIVGAPALRIGERVVVFLSAQGPSMPYVLGLNQGVFRVVPQNGVWVVTPPVSAPGSRRIVRGDASRTPMPLDEFAREVRAQLGARP